MRIPGYHALIGELYHQMHPKNLRLFVNESVGADDANSPIWRSIPTASC